MKKDTIIFVPENSVAGMTAHQIGAYGQNFPLKNPQSEEDKSRLINAMENSNWQGS